MQIKSNNFITRFHPRYRGFFFRLETNTKKYIIHTTYTFLFVHLYLYHTYLFYSRPFALIFPRLHDLACDAANFGDRESALCSEYAALLPRIRVFRRAFEQNFVHHVKSPCFSELLNKERDEKKKEGNLDE